MWLAVQDLLRAAGRGTLCEAGEGLLQQGPGRGGERRGALRVPQQVQGVPHPVRERRDGQVQRPHPGVQRRE